MAKHLARARGVDPSQISRELDGERRSALAAAEEILVRMAVYSRTSPEAYIAYLQRRISEVRIEAGEVGTLSRFWELCHAETEAQHVGDLSQYRFRVQQDAETLLELEDSLARHAVKIHQLLTYVPILRPSLS